jgi:hypothetical protein
MPHLQNVLSPLLLVKAFFSFCAIFWFKQCGVLPGLCFVNELVSHDEALHCDFAFVLYHHLLKPPCYICVREIVDSAIQIEGCSMCQKRVTRLCHQVKAACLANNATIPF